MAPYPFTGVSVSNNLPSSILRDLPWSFAEPQAESLPAFMSALREYCESIDVLFDEAQLQKPFPARALDVRYEYWVREPGGEWREIEAVVQIRKDGNPSCAEVLYLVHRAVAANVAEQDHHFFEGLFLVKEIDGDVPLYELRLGS
jgi:hypothetical protein